MTEYVNKASYTIKKSDKFIEVGYSSIGECEIILPDDQRVNGREIIIVDEGYSADTNNVIIKDDNGTELYRLSDNGQSITLKAKRDNSRWYIF